MIKTLKTFNFRPFPNLGILQFSIFPKYPKFFANALEAKSQGPTKRQRREPLPAVRRLVSPTEWPWSMHLADLGYGRTGKSRVVETWEDETIGLHSVTHVQKNHRTTATPVQVAERSPRGSGIQREAPSHAQCQLCRSQGGRRVVEDGIMEQCSWVRTAEALWSSTGWRLCEVEQICKNSRTEAQLAQKEAADRFHSSGQKYLDLIFVE